MLLANLLSPPLGLRLERSIYMHRTNKSELDSYISKYSEPAVLNEAFYLTYNYCNYGANAAAYEYLYDQMYLGRQAAIRYCTQHSNAEIATEDIVDLVRAYYFLELWRFIKRDYHNDLAAACQDEIGWSQITSLSKYKARYIVSHPKFRYKPNRTHWW